jgi:hypothetical protein
MYGQFKSQYRRNLELLVDECLRLGKSVPVPQYKHGLLVSGGVDDDTKLMLDSAFEIILHEQIGAAPCTRKCLNDPQVRRSIDANKDYALLVNSVQEANKYAAYALTKGG